VAFAGDGWRDLPMNYRIAQNNWLSTAMMELADRNLDGLNPS
jgi:hypothetical protein